MKEQIIHLQNKHNRYMELLSIMNSAIKDMNGSFNDHEKIELSAQDCIDIANALDNEATLLKREIRDKLKVLKQESEDNLKFVENFEADK